MSANPQQVASSSGPPSPRQRRLENDLRRLEELAAHSTIFSFTPAGPLPPGGPPEAYRVRFRGRGLQSMNPGRALTVQPIDEHEVLIQLVAEYPRSAPHMRWLTPQFHPNISAAGAVCLGGWGTDWAPSLQLDRLCEMLWDMLRFANYDTRSPYNQQAARWLLAQRQYSLPLDHRELRDAPRFQPAATADPRPAARAEEADDAEEIVLAELVQYAEEARPPADRPRRAAANSPPDILFLD